MNGTICPAEPARRPLLPWLLSAVPFLLVGCLACGATGLGFPDLHDPAGHTIFMLRLNRLFSGFVVGAALACAGAALQAILRNPLAEPYVLGVSSGAGLGAAAAILLGWSTTHIFALPLAAFIAGVLTLGAVYLVASSNGHRSTYSLILSGVVISAMCSSLLMFLVSTASRQKLHSVIWWMLGNLQPTSQPLLIASAVIIGLGIVVLWSLSPELNVLTLGRDAAHGLGIAVPLTVTVSLLLATAMTAAAVAQSGLIGFVGLMVPHIVRAVAGPDHRRLLPLCCLFGGTFLALCDAVARTVLAPRELPVGVITAMLGGPFFLFLLRNRRHMWKD